jgi:hypothetical protein
MAGYDDVSMRNIAESRQRGVKVQISCLSDSKEARYSKDEIRMFSPRGHCQQEEQGMQS